MILGWETCLLFLSSFLSLGSSRLAACTFSSQSYDSVCFPSCCCVSLLLSFIILQSSFKCQFASCESWVSLPHWMLGSAISPEYQALGKCQSTIRDLIVSISISTNGKAGWSCPKNMMWKEGPRFGVRNPELKPLINSDMSYNHNNSDLFSALQLKSAFTYILSLILLIGFSVPVS